ncbi:MAG: MoaD/ThiS family protein [Gemmatimonadota bacterium]|nr:MoaD/ThiS family protein [Gemmatimonadota bacterium]
MRQVETGIPIRLLLFGPFREMAGRGEMEISVPPGSRVRDLVDQLRSAPPLDALPAAVAVAVNRRFAPPDRDLAAGDEVALVPPVAGG